MYGMVQLGLEQMVKDEHGPDTWNDILDRAGQRGVVFVSNQPYPDEVSYGLVGAASEILKEEPAALLEHFGRYWVAHFAPQHYQTLMDAAGGDMGAFIGNLNDLHVRVGLVFPGYQPPRFEVEPVGDRSLLLHYYSHREGLTPFVVGLLRGIGDRFGQQVEVTLLEATAESHPVFEVQWG